MKRAPGIVLFSVISLLGCEPDVVWKDSPPKFCQGKFTQVSDEIILGYQKPVIIEVGENHLIHSTQSSNSPLDAKELTFEERVYDTLRILKVSETKRKIVISCEEKNSDQVRYELEWINGFLYISQEIPTGLDDDFGVILFGKFVERDYLK